MSKEKLTLKEHRQVASLLSDVYYGLSRVGVYKKQSWTNTKLVSITDAMARVGRDLDDEFNKDYPSENAGYNHRKENKPIGQSYEELYANFETALNIINGRVPTSITSRCLKVERTFWILKTDYKRFEAQDRYHAVKLFR